MIADKTILQMKYSRLIALFAQRRGISIEEAMDFFYNSMTFYCISNGVSDMHAMSDNYLVDELCLEADMPVDSSGKQI